LFLPHWMFSPHEVERFSTHLDVSGSLRSPKESGIHAIEIGILRGSGRWSSRAPSHFCWGIFHFNGGVKNKRGRNLIEVKQL